MESENYYRALARGFCACKPPMKIYIFNMEKTNWHELEIKCRFCNAPIKFCKLENDIIIDLTNTPLTFNRKTQNGEN